MKKTLRRFLTGTSPKTSAPLPGTAPRTKRAVWRISERAPMGEWVDPDAVPETPAGPQQAPPDATSSGWMVSSMDLLSGADVSEDHETSPGELFDEVNRKPREPRRD